MLLERLELVPNCLSVPICGIEGIAKCLTLFSRVRKQNNVLVYTFDQEQEYSGGYRCWCIFDDYIDCEIHALFTSQVLWACLHWEGYQTFATSTRGMPENAIKSHWSSLLKLCENASPTHLGWQPHIPVSNSHQKMLNRNSAELAFCFFPPLKSLWNNLNVHKDGMAIKVCLSLSWASSSVASQRISAGNFKLDSSQLLFRLFH